jgi:DNA-binding transcriptional MerR regulator
MAGLTIGKFADAEGVGVETVRFYHRRGLLAQPARGRSGFREYTKDDRWRLAFIRRARRLGFTLAEISDLLGPAEARSTDEIVRAAEAKLATVADQLVELARLQCRLRRLVQVCAHGSSDDCLALHLGDGHLGDGPDQLSGNAVSSPRAAARLTEGKPSWVRSRP